MFKSLNGGQIPQRATKYSAGFDVFANEDILIGAGETKLIGLGICLDVEILNIGGIDWFCANDGTELINNTSFTAHDHYLELHPRSSLRAKGLGGGVGIIDMDYRDEIKMVIHNPFCGIDYDIPCFVGCNDTDVFEVKRGDKIGQLILKRHEGWLLPAEYTKDEERNGGFGSTDK